MAGGKNRWNFPCCPDNPGVEWRAQGAVADDADGIAAIFNPAGEKRIVRQNSSRSGHDGTAPEALPVDVVSRLLPGNPLGSAGGRGGFSVQGLSFSPIRGPEGNIEFLGHLTVGAGEPFAGDIESLVQKAQR